MTTLSLPLDTYDAAIGLDLKFDVKGDLALDDLDGDLATISGASAVSEAIRRRITTTPEGYTRLLKLTENSLDPIGIGYGSGAVNYLSNPMNNAGLSDDVVEEIDTAVRRDPRVATSQTYVTEVNNVGARLEIALNYKLYAPDTLDGRRLSVGEFSIAGLTIGTVNRNQRLVIPLEG